MATPLLWLSLGGFFFCTAFQKRLDPRLKGTQLKLFTCIRNFLPRKPTEASDLLLLQQIQAQLRAGHSLDGALENLLRDPTLPKEQRRRLTALLQNNPEPDFLSRFLHRALETGIPLLAPLAALQRSLFAEKKLRLKARSMTSQARAQSEVLSYLPWVLGGGVFVLDSEWFFTAAHCSASWVAWAIAFALVGTGRFWMQHLLKKALSPANEDARLEEEVLPKLVLALVAQISLGQDAETALDEAWKGIHKGRDRAAFQAATRRENSLAQFQFIYTSAFQSGAPLRDDLLRFLDDLYVQAEARWEERVQRLPVIMMAPLFLCFFPGTLLVLGGLLFPILRTF